MRKSSQTRNIHKRNGERPYIRYAPRSFAGQTITFGGFAGSQYKAREVGEALRILEKAMLCERVYPTTSIPPGIQKLSVHRN